MPENERVTKQDEGRRIIFMVWVLVAASVAAGALTIGLVGWTILSVKADRSRLIDQESKLVRDSVEVNRLVSLVHSEIETLLQEGQTHTHGENAIKPLREYIQKQLNSNPDPRLQTILAELGTSGANLAGVWNRATAWRTQYNEVLGDIRQQHTLGKVRDLLHSLTGAVDMVEGQRRLQEAMKYRRWRTAQGPQASRLAQEILLGRANEEIQDLRAFQIELGEVARLAEVLAGEEQMDNL
ncbi:MAG: hypothetical protein VST68_01825, partial [Nitrospirota bacterium]|nr:hypothetical protein [Nitrospirota bacterium]